MTGSAGADLLIGRVWRLSAHVAGFDGLHAFHPVVHGFEAPEASARQRDDRSEERRVGKSVDLGGRRIIKKKKISKTNRSVRSKHRQVSHEKRCSRTAEKRKQ